MQILQRRIGEHSLQQKRNVHILCYVNGRNCNLRYHKILVVIKIYSDQTQGQRRYMQNLIKEIKRREENGETDLQTYCVSLLNIE